MDTLAQKLDNAWAMRRRLGSRWSWFRYLYNWLLSRAPGVPLPGRSRAVPVRLRGDPHPFWLRLGTTDWYVFDEIYLQGAYGDVIEHDLGPVHNVLDLGANVGLSVRLWRARFPGARIVAVEPDAANLRICRLNSAPPGGSSGEITFVQACAAGKNGTVSLDRSNGAWAFKMRSDAGPNGEQVAAMTVPDLMKMGRIDIIDLLKCDIEGAEAELFANCADWITKVRHMVVELHPPYTVDTFTKDLRRSGAIFDMCHRMTGSIAEVWFLTQSSVAKA